MQLVLILCVNLQTEKINKYQQEIKRLSKDKIKTLIHNHS